MKAETTMEIKTTSPARKSKRGFTLTEIAIVLGIVGLILGAIWVAAAAVYQNMRVSKANTELLQIAQGVRAMYATQAVVDNLADMPAFGTATTVGKANDTYIAAGVFPTDALDTGNPATAKNTLNPWQGALVINAATNVATNDSFQIAFDKVPTAGCVALITAVTGNGRDPGLFSVQVAAAGTVPTVANGTNTPPVLASAATALCKNPTGNAVAFGFTLK